MIAKLTWQIALAASVAGCSGQSLKGVSGKAGVGGSAANDKEKEEDGDIETEDEAEQPDEPVWVNASYLTCAWSGIVSDTHAAARCQLDLPADVAAAAETAWSVTEKDGQATTDVETKDAATTSATFVMPAKLFGGRIAVAKVTHAGKSREIRRELKEALPSLAAEGSLAPCLEASADASVTSCFEASRIELLADGIVDCATNGVESPDDTTEMSGYNGVRGFINELCPKFIPTAFENQGEVGSDAATLLRVCNLKGYQEAASFKVGTWSNPLDNPLAVWSAADEAFILRPTSFPTNKWIMQVTCKGRLRSYCSLVGKPVKCGR